MRDEQSYLYNSVVEIRVQNTNKTTVKINKNLLKSEVNVKSNVIVQSASAKLSLA